MLMYHSFPSQSINQSLDLYTAPSIQSQMLQKHLVVMVYQRRSLQSSQKLRL